MCTQLCTVHAMPRLPCASARERVGGLLCCPPLPPRDFELPMELVVRGPRGSLCDRVTPYHT